MRLLKQLCTATFGPTTQARYEARHRFLSSLGKRWGLRVYNKNLAWHSDKEFKAIWKQFPEAKNDLIHERKFNLFNITRNLRDVAGDIAECGVFRGSSAFLMLEASEGTGKHYYGFDSFEGLSEPKADDKVDADKTFKWQKHDLAVDEAFAGTNLKKFVGKYNLYKGWIPDRFPEVQDKKFSLVHIDVDLFDPTYDSLKFFWPLMNKGGVIVCDDYGFESCPGAMKAMDDFAQSVGQTVIHLTTGQGMLIKR